MPQLEMTEIVEKTVGKLGDKLGGLIEELKSATGEKQANFEKDIDDLKEQLEGLQGVLRDAKERPSFSGIEVGKNAEEGKFSFGRMAKLLCKAPDADINAKEYGYEKEVFSLGMKEIEFAPGEMKAAIHAATDSGGGFILPSMVMDQIIPELEAMEIAAKLGVTIVNGMQGNVTFVVDDGGISAVYVNTEAEEQGNESASTYSLIEMRPHVVAAFVPLTWSMITQPAISLEPWVRGRIVKKLALREDLSLFLGTGGNSEPLGLFNTTGVQSHDWSTIKWGESAGGGAAEVPNIHGKLIKHVDLAADANALIDGGRPGWAMSNRAHYAFSRVCDTDGHPLFMGINEAKPATLVGDPVFSSTQLKSGALADENLIYGDFSQMMLARWGTMAFASSDETETNFRKLRRTIRGVMAHDVAVLQPNAFVQGLNVDITTPAAL